MEAPGYIALSRQMALRQQMDVMANNMANLNTTGFKGETMLFVEHLETTDDGKTLSLVDSVAVMRDLSQGPIAVSDNPLDLAIRGDGYFVIDTPGGERFTRAGSFTLDDAGQITTQDGFPLMSQANGPIVVPPNSGEITIARDGTISTEQGQLGRIQLVAFEDEQLMKRGDAGLYEIGAAKQTVVDDPHVEQGMLEGSNVQGVIEMTKLIETLRGYQATAKLMEDEHRRQRQAIDALVAA